MPENKKPVLGSGKKDRHGAVKACADAYRAGWDDAMKQAVSKKELYEAICRIGSILWEVGKTDRNEMIKKYEKMLCEQFNLLEVGVFGNKKSGLP